MLSNYFLLIKTNWKPALEKNNFRLQLLLSLLVIISIAVFFPPYFDYLESRNGIVLHDWLLDSIAVYDVSWITFFSVYAGIAVAVASNLVYPKQLLIVFQTYAMVTVLRIVTLYFVHLNPPVNYCELKDPLFSMFFTTHGKVCSKDLFFSGHVSTLLALYFPTKQLKARNIILVCTILIALGVLLQHVHYTIDVLVAPLVTWACFLVSKKLTAEIAE